VFFTFAELFIPTKEEWFFLSGRYTFGCFDSQLASDVIALFWAPIRNIFGAFFFHRSESGLFRK
jgi:hypothetical protein